MCARRRLREIEEGEKTDSVGFGGIPNIMGEMKLDASFMNGDSRAVGAVAAVRNFLPTRVARLLMEKGPHACLVGAGAERFARDCGLHPEPTLSPARYEDWVLEIKPMLESHGPAPLIKLVARWQCPLHSILQTWLHRTVRVCRAPAALPAGRGNIRVD
jgi:Asparaginase